MYKDHFVWHTPFGDSPALLSNLPTYMYVLFKLYLYWQHVNAIKKDNARCRWSLFATWPLILVEIFRFILCHIFTRKVNKLISLYVKCKSKFENNVTSFRIKIVSI